MSTSRTADPHHFSRTPDGGIIATLDPAATVAAVRPDGERWSFSSAALYRLCPLEWANLYGPLREARHAAQRRDEVGDADGLTAPYAPEQETVPQAQGSALHEALAAAYRAAADELTATPGGLPGARMSRYYGAARAALNEAWTGSGTLMRDGDSNLALATLAILRNVLDAEPVPRRGGILAVERYLTATGPDGTPLVARPDLVLRVGETTLRVRDWKLGSIDPADVPHSQQLLLYVFMLTLLYPWAVRVEIELYSMRRATGYVVPADPDAVVAAVRRVEGAAALRAGDAEFLPKPGPHCGRCPVIASCPAMAREHA